MNSQQSSSQSGFNYPTYEDFLNDFEQSQHSLLGQGTYGSVYKWKSKKPLDGQNYEYAVKMIEAKTQKSFIQCQKEFLILRNLPKHPGIVNFIKSYAWQKMSPPSFHLCLVMELADRNLQQEIDARKTQKRFIPDQEFFGILQQAVETFHYISTNKRIYHRDIKPENIMYAKKDTSDIKITDFGVSRQLIEDKLTLQGTLVGTPVYLSPALWQAFEKENFDIQKIGKIEHNVEKSDVYSLGVSMLQTTLLLKNEVIGLNSADNGWKKTQNYLSQVKNPKIAQILTMMLDHDENKRIGYADLILQFFPKPIFPLNTQQRSYSSDNRKIHIVDEQTKRPLPDQGGVANNKGFPLPPISSRNKISNPQVQYCERHPDQVAKYFCFSEVPNNYVCDECYRHLQLSECVSLNDLKARIYGVQYNNFLRQRISEIHKQLYNTSKQIQSQLAIEGELIIQKVREVIIEQNQQNYSQSIIRDLKQNEEENENLITIIHEQKDQQLDSAVIQTILKRQHMITQANQRIFQEIESMMTKKDRILADFRNSVSQRIMDVLKVEFPLAKQEQLDLKGLPNKFTSDQWRISNNQICLEEENRKFNLKCSAIVNLTSPCIGLTIKDNRLYYQTADLGIQVQDIKKMDQKITQIKQLPLKDEQVLCYEFLEQDLILGTKSGKVIRVIKDETIDFLSVKDQSVTHIGCKKQFIVFGLAKGSIYYYDIQDRSELKYESHHQNQITGFAFFDHLKCFISASLFPSLNIHYKDQIEEFDTQLEQVTQLLKVHNQQILTFDSKSNKVKIWNLQLKDVDQNRSKIEITIFEQLDLLEQFNRVLFSQSFTLAIGTRRIKGFLQSKILNEFKLDHQLDNNSQICSHSFENYFAYSIGELILIWTLTLLQ